MEDVEHILQYCPFHENWALLICLNVKNAHSAFLNGLKQGIILNDDEIETLVASLSRDGKESIQETR